MTSGPPDRTLQLSLVRGGAEVSGRKGSAADPASEVGRDVDWSILMARAQGGDGVAYGRLLEEVTPYLRSLAARCHGDRGDVEDAVQDVLLTVHAIRATYDPARPFGPWLLAIANRRLVDRLRRQGRRRRQEVALAAEHESLADARTIGEDPADHQKLETAIGRLPHGQRQAIRLLKLKEMSLRQAAGESGKSVTALKVASHRALASLRKMLRNRGET
ncbi:MAG: sigma-70 family RNA polymerase sigma factor [Rhizobiales bacterium]|nr:sigma-70 family RNA polymerase sigma factor [Hyphomicrobiales bacterium]MBI3674375.1 sigma-70 family RNA polymerase sigma factor [Hyphomicrobiales bacterium]